MSTNFFVYNVYIHILVSSEQGFYITTLNILIVSFPSISSISFSDMLAIKRTLMKSNSSTTEMSLVTRCRSGTGSEH